MQQKTRNQIDKEIIDFSFYLIQRGESGHKNGCHTKEYTCSKGKRTIGYGTVTEPGYNHLNYTKKTITERKAVLLARKEMRFKLYSKCRATFPNFDELLPCYQALILDRAYQGLPENFIMLVKKGASGREKLRRYVASNDNKERAAVRERTVEMGIMIRDAYKKDKNANPEELAQTLAEKMIKNHKSENGTDKELTRDELGLLYRSCMAMYHQEVTKEQVERFANSFKEVATGTHGIGFNERVFMDVKQTVADGVDENGAPKTKVVKLRQKQSRIYPRLIERVADFDLTKDDVILGICSTAEPTAKNNYNNPDPNVLIEKKKSLVFSSLADGYGYMARHIRKRGNHRTCYEILRDYVGVKDVSGSHLLERMRQKGFDIDKNTKLDLDDPTTLAAVTLSIAEFRTNDNLTGGQQLAESAIALAVHPQREEIIARVYPLDALKNASGTHLAQRAQTEKPQTQVAVQKEQKSVAYQETPPSKKNEFNNPARICRKGKPIPYQTLEEGYGALTELLYKNYNGLTCQEIMTRLTGIQSKESGKLLERFLRGYQSEVTSDTKLDLNDPKTLASLALAVTKTRQRGSVLGGQAYAALCVQKKVSALLPANDGVTIHVQQTSQTPHANARLAQVSHMPNDNQFVPQRNNSHTV